MKKIRIAAVSYLNTLPFIYGLKTFFNNSELDLILKNPVECSELYINDAVDIALVPVAILPNLQDYKIISNYCIGADGAVKTVCLYSNMPRQKMKCIQLDKESKTSNLLIKILASQYWQKNYNFSFNTGDGKLVIGDKAFIERKKYKFEVDLAYEWKNFTALPFVFACWVGSNKISSKLSVKLDDAFNYGIKNIDKLDLKEYKNFPVKKYLTNNISYSLNKKKQQALGLFLELIKKL